MSDQELLLQDMENIPEFILEEVWDFLVFLKIKWCSKVRTAHPTNY